MFHFEALGDERFQELAQALIVKEHPTAQCLPVGQPDGGRDAFLLDPASRKKQGVVFQVKFSRDPSSKSERDVIKDLIRTEKPKIEHLKAKGLKKYILVTNVKGTSHPEVGSIDIIHKELTQEFGVEVSCWWSDDLNARVNGNSDIKWSFSEIIKGSDLLQYLVEGAWREDGVARQSALRAYVASQYESESDLKFKQVELQNKIIDLFVDLPCAIITPIEMDAMEEYTWIKEVSSAGKSKEKLVILDRTRGYNKRKDSFDVAEGILTNASGPKFSRVVLEGAPGQGKSTVTQFVCQISRMKILDRQNDLNKIEDRYKAIPIRVPFRIDLRDYAAWVSGRNPFSADRLDYSHGKSLECFIAAQVSHLSGGLAFSPNDFISIVKHAHVQIILDGFDEVADIGTRKNVVLELEQASSRLSFHSQKFLTQMIVTSRPAAFANSPGFSHETWLHLEIQSMTADQINKYADKWMSARRLQPRERGEFRSLLAEKLSQPHMRDLARNPMQLTILLALVHTRGLSLPDKRTSLYDNYMDLFFSREAEKSRVVREYRDLLIDIHRYVAWRLHVKAELGDSSGSISERDLKQELEGYLIKEGHSTNLIDILFTGMVERVVALVSRVQGLYEFEVQPLREYFAARYLYESAPYSPPGSERTGTKPERFDALARNPYWLNVTRFYCGCFSKGELSSLVDSLQILAEDDLYKYNGHPQALCLMLLGDWVFSQQPLLVRRLVEGLFVYPQLKILLSFIDSSSSLSLSLQDACGGKSVAGKCLDEFVRLEGEEERYSFYGIVTQDISVMDRIERWQSVSFKNELDRYRLAIDLDILKHLDDKQIEECFDVIPSSMLWMDDDRIINVVNKNPHLREKAVEIALLGGDSAARFESLTAKTAAWNSIRFMTSNYIYGSLARLNDEIPFQSFVENNLFNKEGDDDREEIYNLGGLVFSTFKSEILNDTKYWKSSAEPWQNILNSSLKTYGPHLAFKKLGILAAGYNISPVVEFDKDNFWKADHSFISRMRYARLRSGNVSWWREQTSKKQQFENLEFAILFLLTWGTSKTIAALCGRIGEVLDSFDDARWSVFASASIDIIRNTGAIRPDIVKCDFGNVKISPRFIAIFSYRCAATLCLRFFEEMWDLYAGKDVVLAGFQMRSAVAAADASPGRWEELLPYVRASYVSGVTHYRPSRSKLAMELCEARLICQLAVELPQSIVRMAQRVLSDHMGRTVAKIGFVAEDEQWFSA